MTDSAFSFPLFARAIGQRIDRVARDGAFVVAITGPWGSGKTTLMEAVVDELPNDRYLRLQFNAWAHSKQDVVWRAFFVAVVSLLRRTVGATQGDGANHKRDAAELTRMLDDSEQALYTAFVKEIPGHVEIDTGRLVKTGARLALRFVPWGEVASSVTDWVVGRAEQTVRHESTDARIKEEDIDTLWGVFKRSVARQQVARIESLEQFRITIGTVLSRFLSADRRLVVSVDDVDRCLPEQGLEVLEAIKLFFDLPNVVFLIALDQEVLQHGLDIRYQQTQGSSRRITADVYAEKMIDLVFAIPTPTDTAFRSFAESRLPMSKTISDQYGLVESVLPKNPRTWLRFAERAALRLEIARRLTEARPDVDDMEADAVDRLFLKLELLWFRWPHVMRRIRSMAELLTLERATIEAGVLAPDFKALVVQRGSDAERVLLERTTEKIGEMAHLAGHLDDQVFLQLLAKPPHFPASQAGYRLLSELLALDAE